jgi:hypothetical protein
VVVAIGFRPRAADEKPPALDLTNALEASPGIEPGCKDLQPAPEASANLLILTRNPNSVRTALESNGFSLHQKDARGIVWHETAARDTDEMRTTRDRISDDRLKKQGTPASGQGSQLGLTGIYELRKG